MNLEEFQALEFKIYNEIQDFKNKKDDELKNLEYEYILQNAKYKIGDKFNHPVVGELEISRIVPSFVRKGYHICYEFVNATILGETELDKSEKIEMTVQERLDEVFNNPLVKRYFEGR